MKLFLAFALIVFVACSKESTETTQTVQDISGTYYCHDTTYESYNHYPVSPNTYVIYDSNYTIEVSYSDKANNIALFRKQSYTLDKNEAYSFYSSSKAGYTKEIFNIPASNKIYYKLEARAGGNVYYTCITGEKIK